MDRTIEERLSTLEARYETVEDKIKSMEDKVNSAFRRIDEIRELTHDIEIKIIKEISDIKGDIRKISNEIKWYGKVPVILSSGLSFILTAILLLKTLGVI